MLWISVLNILTVNRVITLKVSPIPVIFLVKKNEAEKLSTEYFWTVMISSLATAMSLYSFPICHWLKNRRNLKSYVSLKTGRSSSTIQNFQFTKFQVWECGPKRKLYYVNQHIFLQVKVLCYLTENQFSA